MARKIPVGETISGAYNFAFTQFLAVLGIVWFPYAVFVAIAVGLALLAVPELPRMILSGDFDIDALMGLSRVVLLIGIVGFITSAMVTVALQRKALGKHPEPIWFYFSLGAPVWRMAAAFFLAGLVIIFIALVLSAACVAIWFAAGNLAHGMWLTRVVSILAGVCLLIYIATRLLFFLPAVVTTEETIGIERAWALSRGNFWRIFAVWVATVVPVAIAFWIVSHAIARPLMVWPHTPMDMHQVMRLLVAQFGTFGPLFLFVQFLERLVLLGVGNGAVATAYLSVGGAPRAHAVSPGEG